VAPRAAYHLSYEVEIHAAETYAKYLAVNGPDEKILEILNDELEHSKELSEAIQLIESDKLIIKKKDLASVLETSDLIEG
jgi:HKD family nuclease